MVIAVIVFDDGATACPYIDSC